MKLSTAVGWLVFALVVGWIGWGLLHYWGIARLPPPNPLGGRVTVVEQAGIRVHADPTPYRGTAQEFDPVRELGPGTVAIGSCAEYGLRPGQRVQVTGGWITCP